MKRQDRDSLSGRASAPAAEILAMVAQHEAIRASSARGLSWHVRQLSKSNPGISRWLALAVWTGGAVALAMVQLAIH